jgi:hypothetical protein
MVRIQLRGNCQRCGSLQAVTSGGVAKHGYTVKNGWFEGVCHGNGFPPIQVARDEADRVVAAVRDEVVMLRRKIELIDAGKITPEFVKGHYSALLRDYEQIPFAKASAFQQQEAVKSLSWQTESRARSGESWARDFESLINSVHGTPLVEVKIEAPDPILAGEKRTLDGKTLMVRTAVGQRVYWTHERANGTILKGWTGIAAWRKLPKAD